MKYLNITFILLILKIFSPIIINSEEPPIQLSNVLTESLAPLEIPYNPLYTHLRANIQEFEQTLVKSPLRQEITPIKDEPKTIVWQDNPFNCNTDIQWIRADNFECLDKPVAKPAPVIQAVQAEQPVEVAKQINIGSCNLVNNYTDWDTRLMYAICMAESGGNSNAVNWNDNHGVCMGSGGLLQLGCVHFPNFQLTLDPVANIDAGHRVWLQQGYKAWGAYTNGSYAKFY